MANANGPKPRRRPSEVRGPYSGCWEWTGVTSNGYGITSHGRRAHRAVYEAIYGAIPLGFDVCHACDNRACFRPDHLWLGTRKQNMADCVAKGRQARGAILSDQRLGEANSNVKLTAAAVKAMRADRASGAPLAVLASRYGISRSTVHQVVTRLTWKHVA